MDTWFRGRQSAAYGVVCGKISGLVVLDLDDPDLAGRFAVAFPDLLDTFVVRSGLRGTPHIYWRVDYPVRTRSFSGGDLKAEGSYVVGAGSVIAGGTWQILSDRPVRSISREQLNRVMRFLLPQDAPVAQHQAVKRDGDYVALYRFYVDRLGGRNHALFRAACHMRDAGFPEPDTVALLARVHVSEPSRDGRRESPARRLTEAHSTIHSVYTRPPRMQIAARSEAVSRLPNAVREALLLRPDGVAVARTLEAAHLRGAASGALVTEPLLCRLLKGIVSRETIRKALVACFSDGQPMFCPPENPPALADIPDGISRQKNAYLSVGQKQTSARWYRLPTPDQLCRKLRVADSGSDPITLDDVRSVRLYRQALHRALLKRRPGEYSQALLAGRLSVSRRSIRRYNTALGVRARPTYRETPVWWSTLDRLPQAGDIQRFGLHTGGQFLIDDTGKRWPLKREIAALLLGRGRHVSHMQQGPNTYWCGDLSPVQSRREFSAAAPQNVRLPQPVIALESPMPSAAAPQPPQESLDFAREGASTLRMPETPVNTLKTHQRASKRKYRQPLPESAAEHLARRVRKQVAVMSLPNARRLVDTYGCEATQAALRKIDWLESHGSVTRPAGLLVTLTRVSWRARQRDLNPGAPAPRFAAEPRRHSRADRYVAPQEDPLWQSIPYRDWRAEFFGLDDPLLAPTVEEMAY